MSKRARMKFPCLAGEIARAELTETGLGERLKEADIWRFWAEVVGETVAARAMPVRIIGSTLTVAVSSGPWKQELSFLKSMMMEKINERLGGRIVREIVLKSGSVRPTNFEEQPEVPIRKKKLTARQSAMVDEQSAEIPDPETRTAFAELMKAHLESVQPV